MSFLDKNGLARLWANILALADTKVPNSRTVNGKSLASNITLSASDVGASASGHNHTITDLDGTLPIAKGGTGATTAATALTNLGITATAAELNKMDGITATTAELNYVDGVTSSIQTQLNAKQATITGGATTITGSNLTANRALISNGSGKVAVSAVTSTELGYLDGVTSAIQTQLNTKITSSDLTTALGSYYTKTQIDNYEFITVQDIDTICSATISMASLDNEVSF